MAEDVTLAEASGLGVRSWRIDEGVLVLQFSGTKEERSLRCNCGRNHWIVETRHEGGRPVLAVRCHGCGTKQELRLEAAHALSR